MLSSLKVDDEGGRILVSSLKFSTRSSMRPNCLLIRLVRGVIFRGGKELLGLFETNRSAYQKKTKTKIIKTDGGLGIFSAHAAGPIVVLVYN